MPRAKSLSASGKRPLFRSCGAMAFAVTGHLDSPEAEAHIWGEVCNLW